jgi:hypothetical protein
MLNSEKLNKTSTAKKNKCVYKSNINYKKEINILKYDPLELIEKEHEHLAFMFKEICIYGHDRFKWSHKTCNTMVSKVCKKPISYLDKRKV